MQRIRNGHALLQTHLLLLPHPWHHPRVFQCGELWSREMLFSLFLHCLNVSPGTLEAAQCDSYHGPDAGTTLSRFDFACENSGTSDIPGVYTSRTGLEHWRTIPLCVFASRSSPRKARSTR
jgi:hypothetical protein